MALADLDELLIRATFSSVPLAASISAVSLEVAQPGPSNGPRALEVEECRCPPGYVGLSCQVSEWPASRLRTWRHQQMAVAVPAAVARVPPALRPLSAEGQVMAHFHG